MNRLLLLDTASLYYRAFYGLPTSLKAPDGTVSNAVRGVLDFASRLQTQYQPDVMVACWDDDWRPEWRVELIATYKTHRVVEVVEIGIDEEETPDELADQIPAIAEGLELLGIPVVGAPAAEADDVIGTLATQWKGAVDIVTGDRDLFQLIDDVKPIRVLYTARGVSKLDVFDDAALFAKYGVHADQYVDFAVMRGDPSDGLPGVGGIGDKTAAVLLAEFGSLTAIDKAARDVTSSLKPRVRANLVSSADYIAAARQVVAVKRDMKLPKPKRGKVDTAAFAEFSTEWGLGTVAERALTAFG